MNIQTMPVNATETNIKKLQDNIKIMSNSIRDIINLQDKKINQVHGIIKDFEHKIETVKNDISSLTTHLHEAQKTYTNNINQLKLEKENLEKAQKEQEENLAKLNKCVTKQQ